MNGSLPQHRMLRFPGGSLVVEERFRIMKEEGDLAEHVSNVVLANAAAHLNEVRAAFDSGGGSLEQLVDLVRVAALLTVVVDRLFLGEAVTP